MADSGSDLEKQISYFRSKYELNPRSRVFAPLADLYRRVGRLNEAQRLLEDGLRIHPDYIAALVILGRTHLDAGDHDLARTTLQKVMALDSENLVVLKLLAADAQQREAWKVARQLYERVLQLDPDDNDAADRIARLGRRDGSLPRVPDATTPGQRGDPGHVAGFRDVTLDREQAEHADVRATPSPPPDRPPAETVRPTVPSPAPDRDAARSASAPAGGGTTAASPPAAGSADALQGLATKTLADIYIAQGYREKARAVLLRILEQQPGREDVQARLDELDALPPPDLAPPIDPDASASFSPADTVIPKRRPSEDHIQERKQFADWLRRIKQQQQEDE